MSRVKTDHGATYARRAALLLSALVVVVLIGVGAAPAFAISAGHRTTAISIDPTNPYGTNISALALASDGTLYAVHDDGYVYQVIDGVVTGQIATGFAGYNDRLALSPNGHTLYLGLSQYNPYGDGRLGIVLPIDTVSWTVGAPIVSGAGWVNALAVSPADGTLYVAGPDKDVHQIVAGAVTDSVTLTKTADSLAISPDGSTLYVGDATYGDVGAVTPVATASMTAAIPFTTGAGWVNALAMSPDGATLYVAGPDGEVIPVATATDTVGTAILTGEANPGIGALAASPDGRTIYAGAAGSGKVYPIDAATGTVESAVSTSASAIPSLAAAADGIAYAGGNDGYVYEIVDTFTLTYTAGAHGTVQGTSPQIVDYGNDGSRVTAVPSAGYHFTGWSDGVMTARRTDTNVTADVTVTANFSNTYTLTYTAGAHGTITGTSPQTVVTGTDGDTVTATPATGYHFVTWSDGVLTASRKDTDVTADLTVSASFAINTYTLTYTPGAHGTITGTSPQTVNYLADGSAVTAVPATGYHFTGWSDSVATATRQDMAVTGNITVTANFAINTYTLTYTAGAHGTITGTSPQTVNYLADGSAVTAVPATGYHFVRWSDGVLTASRTDTSVTADVTVSASFAWTKLATMLTITSNKTTASRGQTVGFYGTISPNMAHPTPVVVEIQKGSGTWSTLASRKTFTSSVDHWSHWSYAYAIPLGQARGTYHVRVRFAGNATYLASVSSNRTLIIQ